MNPSERAPFSPDFVKGLFNEMSRTYGLVNLVASFGFTAIWRKVCISQVNPQKGAHIVDLMTGMGEAFSSLHKNFQAIQSITAIDFSTEMCREAKRRAQHLQCQIEVREQDALHSDLKDQFADYVFCSFGLKTLSKEQQRKLAAEVARILKPGGQFSFIEISVPTPSLLRVLFLFYLKFLIPSIGRVFLGNPENYKMLAFYTQSFGDAKVFCHALAEQSLTVQPFDHFFGCATGVSGSKAH